jgi:hypothetical protein
MVMLSGDRLFDAFAGLSVVLVLVAIPFTVPSSSMKMMMGISTRRLQARMKPKSNLSRHNWTDSADPSGGGTCGQLTILPKFT